MLTRPEAEDALRMVGADGVVTGVTFTSAEGVPGLPAVRARRRMAYVCPLFSPEILIGPIVVAGDAGVHVAPPSVEYA